MTSVERRTATAVFSQYRGRRTATGVHADRTAAMLMVAVTACPIRLRAVKQPAAQQLAANDTAFTGLGNYHTI